MKIRAAMRALSDEQLLTAHEKAQADIAFCLKYGYGTGAHVRQARAAEREIIARGRFNDARNHIRRPPDG